MDVSALASVLQNTLQPHDRIRKIAEEKLESFEKHTSYQAALLHLITIDTLPVQVRQAAIVRLKHKIRLFWCKKKDAIISLQDRKLIKENIVEAVIRQSVTKIRSQLILCLWYIVKHDFPNEWTELLPNIINNIKKNNPKRIYGALECMYVLLKKYRYASPKEREPVILIINASFPIILSLFESLISQSNLESNRIICIIMKCFYAVTQFQIPLSLRKAECIKKWMNLVIKMLAYPNPMRWNKQNTNELSKTILMKTKKWAARICTHMFSHFGRPALVKKEDMKEFTSLFFNTFTIPILETFMNILLVQKQSGQITAPVLQLSYSFLSDALSHACLYTIMKPHLNFIIMESVLPTLCLSSEDLVMWSENPQEFVRKSLDVMAGYYDPKIAAQLFLVELIKIRTRDSLPMIINNIEKICIAYSQIHQNQKSTILKHGALEMFGHLHKILLDQEKYLEITEKIIVSYVFPDFFSPHGFLRAKACWVVGQYSQLTYTVEETHAKSAVLVTNSLNDKELPVKLQAAIALSKLVQEQNIVKFIRPQVALILDQFFLLANEIGNEEIILTLGNLIGQIGEDIAPYAVDLTRKLSELFLQLSVVDDEASDDSSTLKALQCIRALNNILYCVESIPEIYLQLENVLHMLIDKTLHFNGIAFFDEILEMIVAFILLSKNISPFMWSMLPRIVVAFHEWAFDYISNIVSPIETFISKGTHMFVSSTNPNYLQLVLSICQTILVDRFDEVESQYACRILETIMAHCRFKVDAVIPTIIQMITSRFFFLDNLSIKLIFCDVVGSASYYNPTIFIQIIYSIGDEFPKKIFNTWLSHLSDMSRSYKHKKLAILGLSSLCLINISQAPNTLKTSFAEILKKTLALLVQIKEGQEDGGHEVSDLYQEDGIDTFALQDVSENEDALGHGHWDMTGNEFQNFDDDEIEEGFCGPLFEVDEFIFFRQCFETLISKEKEFSHSWINSLIPKQKKTI